jgi:hypothetical protein
MLFHRRESNGVPQHARKIYSDQTGKFPVPSADGHNYIMICYAYDLNAILATPYQSKHKSKIVHAFDIVYQRLTMAGSAPRAHVLNNVCPVLVKQCITNQRSKYQLVPPHAHRCNAAERAIRIDTQLHASKRLTRRNSAWTILHIVHDYQQTPIGPAQCELNTYSSPQQQRTWQGHGNPGFYLGPALDHCRCLHV